MKHSQTAKTSNRFKIDIIKFINEEDRAKFTSIVIDLLKDDEFKKLVLEKQAKYKSSFKVEWKNEALKEIGIEPKFMFKFRRVKKTDEWDLDIQLEKLKGADRNEYFDTVKCK